MRAAAAFYAVGVSRHSIYLSRRSSLPYPRERTNVDAARLWSAAKYTHPALADGRIDWDRALVDAMPGLRAAGDLPASRDAVARLMAPLADPSLRIHTGSAAELLRWPAGGADVEW